MQITEFSTFEYEDLVYTKTPSAVDMLGNVVPLNMNHQSCGGAWKDVVDQVLQADVDLDPYVEIDFEEIVRIDQVFRRADNENTKRSVIWLFDLTF